MLSKPKFPNFGAVLDFNRRRLNFFDDDVEGLSPLKDLGIARVSTKIEKFDIAVTDNSSPAVYYLMLKDYDEAGLLIKTITEQFKGDAVKLDIKFVGPDVIDLNIIGRPGNSLIIPALRVPADFKARVQSYYEDNEKSCIITCSATMTHLGTPQIISPGELMTVKTVRIAEME